MMLTVASVTAQSRPTFSIDRILGLELERPGRCLNLHRPWAGIETENESRGNSLSTKQQLCYQQLHRPQQSSPPRATAHWYTGRRPRTAFTNSQVNILDAVFQVNCYPGIQLREQLAQRLDLDEDRIQIWFQNRRAKLRRSLRESRLQVVQTVVSDLGVRHEVMDQLKTKQDVQQLACRLQNVVEKDEL